MADPDIRSLKRTEKYSSLVANEQSQMRDDKDFTDFTITIHNESLHCHKLTLATHSPVLKAMLKTDMAEAAEQKVSLDHINLSIMKSILAYMYTGQVSFHTDQLMDALKACNYLQMEELKEWCTDQAIDILKPNNVIPWLKFGDLLSIDAIKAQCVKVMVENFAEVIKQPDFLDMEYTEVHDCFRDAILASVNRDNILAAALKWISHDTETRLTHTEDLLIQVQLKKCSTVGVSNVMKNFGAVIVSERKAYNLLTNALVHLSLQDKKESETPPKGTLVIVGGQIHDNMSRVCWKQNESKQMVELCKIPSTVGRRHSVCRTPDGFAVMGGEDSDACVMYNVSAKSWSDLPRMLSKRNRHGSLCIKGVIFVLGGRRFNKDSKSVDCLAIEDSCWHCEPDLPVTVVWPKVVNIKNSVYLLSENNELFHMDVEEKVWNKRANLPENKWESFGASMVSLNGLLYVAGGDDMTCAWYNPTMDTWCMGKQPVKVHRYGSLVYHENHFVLLGGCQSHSTNEIEEFNSEAGSWSVSKLKMPASLFNHYAFVLDIPE